MSKNKKIVLSALFMFLLPAVSFAAITNIKSLGEAIINVIWIVFTVIVVICFAVAGVLFLTAMGDSTKLQTAKSAFIWGIAGVVVGILAFGILTIIQNALGT